MPRKKFCEGGERSVKKTKISVPLKNIHRFEGSISRADDRMRIELNKKLKQLFEQIETVDSYVLEAYYDKKAIMKRVEKSVEEGTPPMLMWLRKKQEAEFCK